MRLSGLVKVSVAMWVAVLGLAGVAQGQPYTVSFNLNGSDGGPVEPPESITVEDEICKEQMPTTEEFTKTGYHTSDEWHTREAEGASFKYNKFFSSDEDCQSITDNITLYLNWVPDTYTIKYNLDGGTNSTSNKLEYTFETPTFYIESPTRTGYTFVGWFDSKTGGNSVSSISKGSMGNIELWARWTIITYTVSFNLNGGANNVFSEDFEGTNSFTVVNSTGGQNRWYVGTSTYYAGTKSAYIATSTGTANSYNNTSTVVHMYRDVTFPASSQSYTLSFYCKGTGYSSGDYLSVHLVETTVTPTAGTAVSSGTQLGTTYSGYSSWQQVTISIPASNSGTTKRLVFTWRNSYMSGTPIAVDNIVLTTGAPASITNVPYGNTLSEAQKPEMSGLIRTGYVHDGEWYTRTGTTEADYVYTKFTFGNKGTEVTSATSLYLKWIPTYTVSFSLNECAGTAPASIANVVRGNTLSDAQKPSPRIFTCSGKTNDGKWYTRTAASPYTYTEFVFGTGGTQVMDNITLYLQWTTAKTYTVSFNLNGSSGTAPSPVYVTADNTIFKEDFENTNSFEIVNGSANRWYVGTSTAYAGSKSAYIATSSGTANSYNLTSASVVHLYRDVALPASAQPCTLSFYWKGAGEVNDYLRVYLVDTSTPISSGISLDGPGLGTYSGNAIWQLVTITIPASNNGTTKRLLFTWRNNNEGGTQPPIAVDDIVLKKADYDGGTVTTTAPPTSGLTRTGHVNDGKWYTRTGTTEADYKYTEFFFGDDGTEVTSDVMLYLKWTPAYTVSFNLNGGVSTIFSEDFEGSSHSFTLVNGSQTNQWAVGTATASGGSKSAYISNDGGTSNSYNYSYTSTVHIYRSVTFPVSSQAYTLKFDWKGQGTSNYVYLNVYLADESSSITVGSMPSGTLLGTYYGYTTWQQASISIPATNSGTTKRLVFTWYNYNYNYDPPIAVDNIVLATAVGPASIANVLSGSTISEAKKPSTEGFTQTGYVIHDNDIDKWYTRTWSSSSSSSSYIYTEFKFGENGTKVTSDTTLYLKWTPVYTITFNPNGGSVNLTSGTTGAGGKLASLPTPTRNGYTFDGWFTSSSSSGTEVTESTVFNANTTIYAQWKCTYLDEDGETQYVSNFTEINTNNSISTLYSDWYLVRGNVTLTNSMLTVSGTAHIILADNSSLTVTSGYSGYAGISVSGSNSLTIYAQSTGNNMGNLTATGGSGAAGIGVSGGYSVGSFTINDGTVTINGGVVTATGGSGAAGIGGSSGNSGGTVTINGGVVTATGGSGAQGIGGGSGTSGTGTFAINGDAIVFASGIDGNNESTGGILFAGNVGTFYGKSVTINQNTTIPTNYRLSIPSGSKLTIPSDITLTNNGTITPANGSTIAINGTLVGKINGANTASPTVIMRTAKSVILGDDTKLLASTGQGVEYAISESDDAPASGWQTSPVFTGLKPQTEYYVFTRSETNDNFKAGSASAALQIETMSLTPVIAAPNCLGTACYTTPASYYTLRGTPLGAQKPTAPGVYIEKLGYVSRKIVVR